MLALRPEQLQAIDDALFEEWMKAHLLQFFPQHCAGLGRRGVRDAIRYGIEQARRHGFEETPEVAQFLDLLFIFNRGFDVRYEWAAAALAGRGSDPRVKMARLYEAALAFLRPAEEEA